MTHSNPDYIRNIEKKYLISKHLKDRYEKVKTFLPGQLASLMTDYFISILEQAEERQAAQQNEFRRRSNDVIRAH